MLTIAKIAGMVVGVLMGIIVQAGAAEYYVATDGNDANRGTKAKPFATLDRARKAVRETDKRPATVTFRGGTHVLSKTLTLGDSDSGTTWRAEAGEHVFLRGGVTIPAAAFVPVTDPTEQEHLPATATNHVLVADLKALGITDYGDPVEIGRRPELFFGADPMTLARWPNEGFAKIADVGKTQPQQAGSDKASTWELKPADDRYKHWVAEAGTMRMFGYWFHNWADGYQSVAKIDPAAGVISLAEPYHHYGYRKGQRFYALNLLCELDAPSEWYLDRDAGRLYFYPPALSSAEGPARIASAEVTLSLLEGPLVEMKDASDVRLEGLTFELTRGLAVTIAGGKGNRIVNCILRNTGSDAARITGGADHGVTGCEIYRTGRCGVLLDGGDRETLTPAGHFVTDCEFHHFSRLKRTYTPAVQCNGVGNRVAHNHIHDAPHMAVGFSGNDNIMEYNDIHDVCQETGDVGVFYTGRDWTVRGNEIRCNFIHHAGEPGLNGAQGVYIDDAGSGTIIRSNVLYKVQRAIQMGGGRDNVIENNLIVDCPRSLDFDTRGLGWMKKYVAPGGIMQQRLKGLPYKTPPWSTRYPPLPTLLEDEPGCPKGNVIRHNVALRSGRMNLAPEVIKFGTVADNLETKDDIGLVDVEKLDFRLTPDTPLLKLLPGFQPIPFEQIGRTTKKRL